MTRLSSTVLHEAPLAAVSGALRSVSVLRQSVRDAGHDVAVPGRPDGLLVAGDEVHFLLDVLGTRIEVVVGMVSSDLGGQHSSLVRGPRPFPPHSMALDHQTSLHLAGRATTATDDVAWTAPLGLLGGFADALLLRRIGRDVLRQRGVAIDAAARALVTAPEVAAGAVVREGKVLVARLPAGHPEAGRWELPGGAVEGGEDGAAAVVRELAEELSLVVSAGAQVGADVPLADGRALRAYAAGWVSGEPVFRVHDEVRWVGGAELAALDLVGNDRGWLPELRAALP